MNPALCREINLMSLEQIANYFSVDYQQVIDIYNELLDDKTFLKELNYKIGEVREVYQKGIFAKDSVDSADWFALQRIVLYILVRLFKPACIVETGVFYGGTTAFILNALRKNNYGELISIDLKRSAFSDERRHYLVNDGEYIPDGLDVGFIVHDDLKERWTLIRGNSLEEIPKLNSKIDFYVHDSDHSYDFVKNEFKCVSNQLTSDAIIMVDDIDWSNAFFSICCEERLYPLLLTDNGKDNLRMRTGVAWLSHKLRSNVDTVGSYLL